ncbi:MAG TPA: SsrA-binding protein SmpB [Acidimicrobiia bacterium]|nr:SsrA-binding protein SmpB [Acidimicrobiia bacterium]
MKVIATNRKARHDYEILDRFEAGLALEGSEVKSVREGKVVLKDSFAHVRDGELWLVGAYIAPYQFSRGGGHDPERTRKLLLKRREIDRIAAKLAEKGLTLIPLQVYLKDGRAKVELGLGRGKRSIDKRETIKERDQQREMERALRRR